MSNRKIIVTESERERIIGLYENKPTIDFIISDWLSPDEKFVIFLDELYDIDKKLKLGNIWENFDNFKIFIKHSFDVAKNIPQDIKESINESLNKLVLTESTQNLSRLKPYIKEFLLNEGIGDVLNDVGGWLKNQVSDAVTSTGDFISKSYEGIKGVLKGISQGQWSEVINLLGKGALWVARKLRSALYTPIGLILDAILIATGIGKGAQFVIWGVVVALDIYELSTGNFEDKGESYVARLFFTGIDMIGLVTAGAAAKASKIFVGSIFKEFGTSTKGLSKAAKSNSTFKSVLQKTMSATEAVSNKMGEVAKYLQSKSPMLYKFVSGIMRFLGKIISKLYNLIKSILGIPGKAIEKTLGTGKLGKGVKAATNIGGGAYALQTDMGKNIIGKGASMLGLGTSDEDILKLLNSAGVAEYTQGIDY